MYRKTNPRISGRPMPPRGRSTPARIRSCRWSSCAFRSHRERWRPAYLYLTLKAPLFAETIVKEIIIVRRRTQDWASAIIISITVPSTTHQTGIWCERKKLRRIITRFNNLFIGGRGGDGRAFVCTVGVDPRSLPYSQFRFARGSEEKGGTWIGVAWRLPSLSLFSFC